ncbi:unnamed protein product [Vitrella brassicaformis CCMP3155]|uniref:Uncharacterized protein n=1 Tax=Vitrella brassicaformis (strain CCMP3155) TaxID=1169540 RepID=A0A0G4H681_VITBC|nr:unnamed protein product [Vitrella brassicaformis CCMP3155]|eukprot:CEM39370.1 unnamed protein product [Vitrella brassicaformis CCMP3155]
MQRHLARENTKERYYHRIGNLTAVVTYVASLSQEPLYRRRPKREAFLSTPSEKAIGHFDQTRAKRDAPPKNASRVSRAMRISSRRW